MGSRNGSRFQRWVFTVAAGVVLAATVVVGLRYEPRDCTRVGLAGPSNVALAVADSGWTIVEFCVSGDCETTARVEVGDDAELHPFTASLDDGQGRTVDVSGEVTTVVVQPNGEGCPPKHAFATVSVAADGTVMTSAP
jgi:hypothetical protein